MTESRPLNGQDIGQAHLATRAVLEQLLAGADVPFNGWVTLNVLGGGELPFDENDLVSQVGQGLKIDAAAVRALLSDLAGRDLIVRTTTPEGVRISLTPAGSTRYDEVRQGLAGITQRLYGGLATEDLIVAQRVLTTVTGRANAELAG